MRLDCTLLPHFILARACIVLILAGHVPAAALATSHMNDPASAFALAHKINEFQILETKQIAMIRGGVETTIIAGIYCQEGDTLAGLAVLRQDTIPPTWRKALSLGPGDRIQQLEIVDLKGQPGTIHLENLQRQDSNASRKHGDWNCPAVFLIVNEKIARRENLIIVDLTSSPNVLLRADVRSEGINGVILETLDISLLKGLGKYLDILLVQHVLPAEAATPQRPGPPRRIRFLMIDGVYKMKK